MKKTVLGKGKEKSAGPLYDPWLTSSTGVGGEGGVGERKQV